MQDNIFIDPNSFNIPSYELRHAKQKVSFAYRTMEEIYDKIGGKPDVPHRHDYYTVVWAKEACGKHYVDYKEYDMAPHIVFFVSPGQVHQVISNCKPVGCAIMFTKEFLIENSIREDFITNLGLFSDSPDTPPIKIPLEAVGRIDEICENIEFVFNEEQPFKIDAIGAWLKLFLIECNRHAPELNVNNQSLHSGGQILKEFKALLEQNYTAYHKVSDYAEKLGISPDYLNSVLKTTIGRNAKEYIQNRIVLEAKRLGVHTALSSKEIAYQLGFDDPAHFSKFFKNVSGSSFSDFRASILDSVIVPQ